jgi:hypothetical protein
MDDCGHRVGRALRADCRPTVEGGDFRYAGTIIHEILTILMKSCEIVRPVSPLKR